MGVTMECVNDINPEKLMHWALPRSGVRWSRLPRFCLILPLMRTLGDLQRVFVEARRRPARRWKALGIYFRSSIDFLGI